jgi:hypothetical protein
LTDPAPSVLTFEKWIEPTENGQTYNLELTVDGKTGRRTLVPTRQAAYAFFALKHAREETLGHDVDPEEKVFCIRNGKFQSADSLHPLFKQFLEDAELLKDEHGLAIEPRAFNAVIATIFSHRFASRPISFNALRLTLRARQLSPIGTSRSADPSKNAKSEFRIGSRPTERGFAHGNIWQLTRASCMPMVMPGSMTSTARAM